MFENKFFARILKTAAFGSALMLATAAGCVLEDELDPEPEPTEISLEATIEADGSVAYEWAGPAMAELVVLPVTDLDAGASCGQGGPDGDYSLANAWGLQCYDPALGGSEPQGCFSGPVIHGAVPDGAWQSNFGTEEMQLQDGVRYLVYINEYIDFTWSCHEFTYNAVDQTPGTAQVRFMNPSSMDTPIDFRSESASEGFDYDVQIETAAGVDYAEFPAGYHNFFAVGAGGELARMDDVLLEADKRYTVAGLGLNSGVDMLLVKEDDAEGIPADHTRLNFINIYPDAQAQAEGWILYPNPDSTWTVRGNFSGDFGSVSTEDQAFAATPVHLEATWPLPTDPTNKLLATWNIAAYVQMSPGSIIDVYIGFSGQCDLNEPAIDCNPYIIGQLPDGSTATVQLDSWGNTPAM